MMLKLLKHEIRKGAVSAAILLALSCVLELYFLFALWQDKEGHLAAAILLLCAAGFGAIIYVLVRGVLAYSSELRGNTGYLLFMTPNPPLRILGSKYLFSLINTAFFGSLYACMAIVDIGMIWSKYDDWASIVEQVTYFMRSIGINTGDILLSMALSVGYILLGFVSVIGLAYLSITISYTVLGQKKHRKLLTTVIFIILYFAESRIEALFTSPMDELVISGGAESLSNSVGVLGPGAIISAVVLIISLLVSSWLLDRKVSL